MKPAQHTRVGIRGKFPPKKNGCFGKQLEFPFVKPMSVKDARRKKALWGKGKKDATK